MWVFIYILTYWNVYKIPREAPEFFDVEID